MVVLFVVSRLGMHRVPWLEWSQAFAEAAMVGALADWFAVVALFRHPLGLRIPHTAILVTRKAEIAHTLGTFVASNFLQKEVVASRLQRVDLVSLALGWIQQHAQDLSVRLCELVPRLLEGLQERPVAAWIQAQLRKQLEALPLAPLAGRMLGVLTAGGRHEVLLDEILRLASRFLEEHAERVCASVEKQVPLPDHMFGWEIRRPVAQFVAERLVRALQDLLRSASQDRHHPMRVRFHERVQRFVEDLKCSPEYARKGEEIKQELLQNQALEQYAQSVWQDARAWVLTAASERGGAMERHVAVFLEETASTLLADAALVERLNGWLRGALAELVDRHRVGFGEMIEETVNSWDGAMMSEKLENEVGADLQFIRVNGTLIGGVVGLLIHAVSRWIG